MRILVLGAPGSSGAPSAASLAPVTGLPSWLSAPGHPGGSGTEDLP